MAQRAQLSLFPREIVTEFGGSLNLGKRKERRPIAVKRPMHVTLCTPYSLSRHRKAIIELLRKEAQLSHVTIYEL